MPGILPRSTSGGAIRVSGKSLFYVRGGNEMGVLGIGILVLLAIGSVVLIVFSAIFGGAVDIVFSVFALLFVLFGIGAIASMDLD